MDEFTPWYPPNIDPVRTGIYQVSVWPGTGKWWRFWDGKEWHVGTDSFNLASLQGGRGQIPIYWRGLTKRAALSRATGE